MYIHGLSAADPCLRLWLSVIYTLYKDVHAIIAGVGITTPHLSMCGDNTTPISNDRSSTRANGVVTSPHRGRLSAYRPCSVGLGLTPQRISSRPTSDHLRPGNPQLGPLPNRSLAASNDDTVLNGSCVCFGIEHGNMEHKLVYEKV